MTEQQQIPRFETPMSSLGSTVLQLINPQPSIEALKLSLMGFMEDSSGNIVRVSEPLLNDAGINAVIQNLTSVVNTITPLSSLNDKEVYSIICYFADNISKDFMMNAQVYGLNPRNRDRIYSTICTRAYIALKNPREEGIRRFLKHSIQEMNITQKTQESKGLGKWLGWRGQTP